MREGWYPLLSVTILVAAIFAVVLAILGTVFTVLGVRDRRRRRRREEHGVRVQAAVAAVEPAIPEKRGQNEQPFLLRFSAPDGAGHEQWFTSGFGGIVPAEGWQVEVLFDPADPGNAEITRNPYVHGINGAAAGHPPGRRWLVGALSAATAALVLGGVGLMVVTLVRHSPGDAAYTGYFLTAAGLVFYAPAVALAGSGIGMVADARRKQRTAVTAAGVVTQTWTEVRRSSDGDSSRAHPYAVRFALPDGRHVHRRAYDTPGLDRNRTGRQVEVVYQPAEPTRFAVGGPGRLLLAPVLTLALGLVFAVVATVLTVVGANV